MCRLLGLVLLAGIAATRMSPACATMTAAVIASAPADSCGDMPIPARDPRHHADGTGAQTPSAGCTALPALAAALAQPTGVPATFRRPEALGGTPASAPRTPLPPPRSA